MSFLQEMNSTSNAALHFALFLS